MLAKDGPAAGDVLYPPSLLGLWRCERTVSSVEGDAQQACNQPATDLQPTCNPTRAHDATCRVDAPSQAAATNALQPATVRRRRRAPGGCWAATASCVSLRPICCATCRRSTYYGSTYYGSTSMAILTMAVLTMALFPIAAGRGVRCGRQDEGDGGRHGRHRTRHHGH
eukprot:scaffold36091_cov67-Phaeocystis_antarctica.AAC.3